MDHAGAEQGGASAAPRGPVSTGKVTPSTPSTPATPSNAQAPRPHRGDAKPMGQWNVVLLDDQEHSYDYVIRMMRELFGLTRDRALRVAQAVDTDGRAVCMTTHKEHAELKQEQITAYGRDPQMSSSTGPMRSVIEPAT